MNWKKRHRSFYYKYAEDPNDIILKSDETAHLIIDVQKTYLEPKDNSEENAEWEPFFNRMSGLVIPNIKNLISFLREKKVENIFSKSVFFQYWIFSKGPAYQILAPNSI